MRRYVIAMVLLGSVWLLVVVAHWLAGRQESSGPVGDALAPVGSMLTALTLLFAFKQGHADANRSHFDKLAAAYPIWFEKAWRSITDAIDVVDAAIKDDSMPELTRAVAAAYQRERELRLAAAPTLMLEQDKTFADRLRQTHANFPSWSGPPKITSEEVGQYRAFVKRFAIILRERRDDIESLFFDVAHRLGARSALNTG